MNVVEKFVSIEGEGKRAGSVCAFIRLAGCNLRCSYCDTPYSHKASDGREETIDSIVQWFLWQGVKNVTVTGGEPLAATNITDLLAALIKAGAFVNVETNGSYHIGAIRSRVLENLMSQSVHVPMHALFFTVDYKSQSSNMNNKMCPANFSSFNTLTEVDCVKFVVASVDEILDAYSVYVNVSDKVPCYFSPVFGKITATEIAEYLVCNAIRFPHNAFVQVQLHKILWDPNKRGV